MYYAHEVFAKYETKLTCGFDKTRSECEQSYCTFEANGEYVGTVWYKHGLVLEI